MNTRGRWTFEIANLNLILETGEGCGGIGGSSIDLLKNFPGVAAHDATIRSHRIIRPGAAASSKGAAQTVHSREGCEMDGRREIAPDAEIPGERRGCTATGNL